MGIAWAAVTVCHLLCAIYCVQLLCAICEMFLYPNLSQWVMVYSTHEATPTYPNSLV